MTENIAGTIRDWCAKKLPEETIRDLDDGQMSAIPISFF